MRYLVGAAGLQDLLNQQIDAQGRFRVVQRFEIVPRSGILRPTKVEDFTVATATNGNFAVFEFTGALPRAKLYSQWQVNTNDDATLQLLASKEFDPARIVLVAEPLPSPKEVAPNTLAGAGTVEFTSYAPKRIVLQTQAASSSVLLLNDKHDPNWQVLVDGKPAPLLRCNFIMRGVFLEPGGHTVEFRFKPPVNALYISLTAISLGLGLLGFAFANGRRPVSPAGPGAKPV
jgi:hypothetical protein